MLIKSILLHCAEQTLTRKKFLEHRVVQYWSKIIVVDRFSVEKGEFSRRILSLRANVLQPNQILALACAPQSKWLVFMLSVPFFYFGNLEKSQSRHGQIFPQMQTAQLSKQNTIKNSVLMLIKSLLLHCAEQTLTQNKCLEYRVVQCWSKIIVVDLFFH